MEERKHMQLVSCSLQGLFGRIDHSVHFDEGTPTILTGPNGVGKTHFLRLIRAAIAFDLEELADAPFDSFELTFTDGSVLDITRQTDPEGRFESINLSAKGADGTPTLPILLQADEIDGITPEFPDYYHQLSDGRWLDLRTKRIQPVERLARIHNVNIHGVERALETSSYLVELAHNGRKKPPLYIDTKRLDRNPTFEGQTSFSHQQESTASSRISDYIDQLQSEVTEARRQSLRATQRADLSFAERAIEAAHKNVNPDALRSKYQHVIDTHSELLANSLVIGEAEVSLPDKLTPTIKRIMDVFLDDWDRRQQPLVPLNRKISTLRSVLDSKLAPSGKSTAISRQGRLIFRNNYRQVPVENLSSGEQHLVALFTMLLFSARENTVILIDEPEISLHATWKHQFLSDIMKISSIHGIQVILATHSTAIINGHWDVTRELSLPPEELHPSQFDTDINELEDDDEHH